MTDMPPLPAPQDGPNYHTGGIALFNDDQMHAYARAYAASEVSKERERCAKVCEGLNHLLEDSASYASNIRKGE